MSDERRDRPPLSAEERDFIDRLNAQFSPPRLTAARRAVLDQRVRERVATPRWGGGLAPAWVAASLAALAFIWISFPADRDIQNPTPAVALVGTDPPEGWTQRVLYGDLSDDTLDESESGLSLPPDYAAIDSLFFEG